MAQSMTTITGNLTRDPELKYFEKTGSERGRLRVAVNRRFRNDKNQWEDGPTLYISVEVWGQLARNCKISLLRGMPVVATGHLVNTEWQVKGEEKPRHQVMLKANHVGLDLSWHIASSRKTDPEEKRIEALRIPDMEVENLYDEKVPAPPEEPSEEIPDLTDSSVVVDEQPGF